MEMSCHDVLYLEAQSNCFDGRRRAEQCSVRDSEETLGLQTRQINPELD